MGLSVHLPGLYAVGVLTGYLIAEQDGGEDRLDPLSGLIPAVIRELPTFEMADPAAFLRPLELREGRMGEAEILSERRPPGMFLPRPTLVDHPGDSRREVVVTDLPSGNTTIGPQA